MGGGHSLGGHREATRHRPPGSHGGGAAEVPPEVGRRLTCSVLGARAQRAVQGALRGTGPEEAGPHTGVSHSSPARERGRGQTAKGGGWLGGIQEVKPVGRGDEEGVGVKMRTGPRRPSGVRLGQRFESQVHPGCCSSSSLAVHQTPASCPSAAGHGVLVARVGRGCVLLPQEDNLSSS